MDNVVPVILSGGSGTRLWPLSRKHYPKQFHRLTGGEYTLLQDTVLRVKHLANPIVVCNESHRFMVAEQLRTAGVDPAAILLEPVARNTAPAIALAALQAIATAPDAVLAVFPADHIIADQNSFESALDTAVDAARGDYLVTFGVPPTHAETGYGYIEFVKSDDAPYTVSRFVEKPDRATAEQYLASGNYLWNSGMFVFRARTYLDALARHAPEILEAATVAMQHAESDLDFIRVDADRFASSPDESIDYAVMEKVQNALVVPLDVGWSDIGGWPSLWEAMAKDESNTVSMGDVIKLDTHNTLIQNHCEDKLLVTIGLDDLVIIDTKNALLVAHKDQVHHVKDVVSTIAEQKRDEHLHHREVHRPWGSYDSIGKGHRYQVKRITVKPGASLSLQMHHHRAEHWVIVSGTAEVQVGEKRSVLTENQSVYIPLGETHRLTNPGKLPLELIEVQSGSYLGEDDIVRFEDVFGRA